MPIMTVMSAAEAGLQNVYTPLSPTQHFYFCLVATIVYLVKFYRDGGWHNLLLILAIDLTYITQTTSGTTDTGIMLLGISEAVILSAALVMNIIYTRKKKAEKREAEAAEDEENERRSAVENEQQDKDERFVDNAFDE